MLVEASTPSRAAAASALAFELDVLRDGVPVIRDVQLDLPAGAAVGIVGRNGVGKTTLLSGLFGFLPTSGPVSLFGERIERWPAHRRAERGLALVPQGRRLFADLTVAENLRTAQVSRPGRGPRVDIHRLFPRLGELLSRRAGVLSGGQQQQVAIARALLRRPTVLLLDEPTEGLAPSVVDEVVAALVTLRAEGLTLLVAEQRLDVLTAVCDDIAVVQAGEIAARGPSSSLEVQQHLLAL